MNRVLNIVPYPFLPFFSGGQKLIAHFNKYLGEQCVLHVAGTAANNAVLAEHYSFHPLLKKSKLRYADFFSFFRLKQLIRSEKIDTVIVEHPYLGWLGWLLKKSCPVRLIIHTHNIEFERFRTVGKSWWPILKIYETWTLKQADLVFCISEEDRLFMVQKMNIPDRKCVLVPYGINQHEIPADKEQSKITVCKNHNLDPEHALLFFNGLLDYKPNTDAVRTIIDRINPFLLQSGLPYTILIAGKRLPAVFNGLKEWNHQHIFYAGFVDDIDLYTKAADVLLNPVNSGGGVKTKMIEALGLNTSVVATETGAAGVKQEVCGGKLIITTDSDWQGFADAVIHQLNTKTTVPSSFYAEYYWRNIISRIKDL